MDEVVEERMNEDLNAALADEASQALRAELARLARVAHIADELERLVALRRDYDGHAEHSELMIDPLWLEFTRWLYEQGRISEDLPESDMPALADWSAPD